MQFRNMILQDYLFISAICFNIVALASTYFLVFRVSSIAGAGVGQALESNPINTILLNIPALQLLFMIGFWVFITVSYCLSRRQFLQGKSKLSFSFFVWALFLLLALDMINDIALVARIL